MKGLGEFAWRNGIDLASRLHIVADAVEPPSALRLELPRLTCVPVGGGKDSIVTVECLKQAGEPLVLFSLGNAAPIEATIAQAGLPAIRVTRRLDPALFALNEAGALNGHVPITGILSMIVLACAIIHGFDAIAMSNEHSASAPNIADVNHQYSKSFEFEQAFSRLLERHVVEGVRYFSLLRPLSEVAIARRFARHAAYLPCFRSCNTAFRQSAERRGTTGAATVRNAASSFWRWRRSWSGSAWLRRSAATCWMIRRRSTGLPSCAGCSGTSRSNASARSRRAPR